MTTSTSGSPLRWITAAVTTLGELAEHSTGYAPYCNLNVVDMWAYRVRPVRWARVGDAVVYRLSDYMTDEPYFTVLGRESVRLAVVELMRWAGDDHVTLKCVPAESVEAFGDWNAITDCEEDVDNCDYVLDVDALVDLRAKHLRRQQQALVRRHPRLTVRELDRSNSNDRAQLYRLFRRWVSQTAATEWERELLALRRALLMPAQHLVCLGIYDRSDLIAYCVNGPGAGGCYQGFFGKVDRRYSGLGVHLEHETAGHMSARYGARLLNLQPDSGLPGLRRYKRSLGPCNMLLKYTVSIRL